MGEEVDSCPVTLTTAQPTYPRNSCPPETLKCAQVAGLLGRPRSPLGFLSLTDHSKIQRET